MNYQELSKEVSYILRHAPWEYNLELDVEGWVDVEKLVEALRINPKWSNLKLADLDIMLNESTKKRHEIVAGKIRAFYGHSIPTKIIKQESIPPHVLYHGTTRKVKNIILEEGLKSRQRQYVHLSQDVATATLVAKRRDDKPVILIVDAKSAVADGLKFYLGNENVWLADEVPAKYLKIKG